MKLPEVTKTIVDREKITDYLLNTAHPDNGGKGQFFLELGFTRERWETLAIALKTIADTCDVRLATESRHGAKYVIVGRLQSPIGKTPMVQTVWLMDKGADAARLVTAYPYKERPHDKRT